MITINEIKKILEAYKTESGPIRKSGLKGGSSIISALTQFTDEPTRAATPNDPLIDDNLKSLIMTLVMRVKSPLRKKGTYVAHERAAQAVESKIELYPVYRELYQHDSFTNYIFYLHLFSRLKLPEHCSSLPENAKLHFTNALSLFIRNSKLDAPLHCQWLMQLDPYQLSVLTELATEPSTDARVNPVFLAIKLNQAKRNIAGMTPESFGQHFNAHSKRYQTRIDLCNWLLKNLFPLENPDLIDQCLTSYVDEYLKPSRGDNLLRYGNSPFPKDSRMSEKIFTLLISLSTELTEECLYNLIESYNEPLLIQLDRMKSQMDERQIDAKSKGITSMDYFYGYNTPLRLLGLTPYIKQIKVCFSYFTHLNVDEMWRTINKQGSILNWQEPGARTNLLDYKLYILIKLHNRAVSDLESYERVRDTIFILQTYSKRPVHELIDSLIKNFMPCFKVKHAPNDIAELFQAVTLMVGHYLPSYAIFNDAGVIHNNYKERIMAKIRENRVIHATTRVIHAAHQVSMLFHNDRLKGLGLFSKFPLPVLAKIAGWVEPGLSEKDAERVAGWHLHIKPQKI